ncbi:MAG TPA: thermonuclease family protein [Synergistaceae bacterium]|nr:thermonuclease family protein [Synergistaceae bacterium]
MAIIYGKAFFIEKKRKLLFPLFFLFFVFTLSSAPPSSASGDLTVRIIEVYDGDTVRIEEPSGKQEILRYAGMDTPELHHPRHPPEEFALAARERNRSLAKGRTLRLSLASPERDRYGRLLGYLYIGAPGQECTIQEVLLREGLGVPRYGSPESSFYPSFAGAFREARQFRRGFWKCAGKRLFTPSQVWEFLPYLRGRWITLCCLSGEWKQGPSRLLIATEDPRFFLCISLKEVEKELLEELRNSKGSRIFVFGKISVSYGGVFLTVHHACQIL